MVWTFLTVLATAAQAATGLAEIPGPHGEEFVAVFYPTESEGPPVQRWQFSLPLVEQAAAGARQRPAGGHLARFAQQPMDERGLGDRLDTGRIHRRCAMAPARQLQ